jgi:hypothetical protein
MTIDGLSQSTGEERLVDIGAAGADLRLVIRDRKLGVELGQAVVPADALMGVLAEQPKGPQTIPGTDATLEVEVRRNEVLLAIGGPDAAVGLDDLMDAVGGVQPDGDA